MIFDSAVGSVALAMSGTELHEQSFINIRMILKSCVSAVASSLSARLIRILRSSNCIARVCSAAAAVLSAAAAFRASACSSRSPTAHSSAAAPVPGAGSMPAYPIVAALALGASAVQMGTAFLGCRETPITEAWRQQLFSNEADQLVVTSVLSGKPARGIRNRYITELEALDEVMLPYPLQYSLSGALRASAQAQNNPDFLAMWSGQGIGLLQETTIEALMKSLVTDARRLISEL